MHALSLLPTAVAIDVAGSLAVGAAAGFIGAIPPGPVGLSVMHHASERRLGDAIRAGLGGATVDVAICATVGVGAGPLLARLASPVVRCSLAIVYVAVGVVVLVRELRKTTGTGIGKASAAPSRAPLSYASGLARGALNPALFANWGLVITFLLANGLLAPRPASVLPFAAGAGIGVASWFAVLAYLIACPRPGWTDSWVRRATLVAALGVVVAGGAGVFHALGAE